MTASNDPDPRGSASAAAPSNDLDSPRPAGDADALRADIAATRADLAEAVTELAARTDVKARAHDAVDSAKAHVHDAVSGAAASAKEVAATAAGVVLNAGVIAGQSVAAVAHKAKEAVSRGSDDQPAAHDDGAPSAIAPRRAAEDG